jgi:hypothetical protein
VLDVALCAANQGCFSATSTNPYSPFKELSDQVCTLVVQELDPAALLFSGSFGRGE